MSPRLFTHDEAEATLPYVRRVVADLVRDFRDWQDVLCQYELAAARVRASEDGGPTDSGEALALEQRAGQLAAGIERYIAELNAVGAEPRSYGEGLVDFPGERDGYPVRWSWRLGETGIAHWRDSSGDDAERHPLSDHPATIGDDER
jgi:hypothetical protein